MLQTNLTGLLKCDRQFTNHLCFSFTNSFYWLFPRWMRKMNPKHKRNVPSGLSGSWGASAYSKSPYLDTTIRWWCLSKVDLVVSRVTWHIKNISRSTCAIYMWHRTAWTAMSYIQRTICSRLVWQYNWQIRWSLTARHRLHPWGC